MHEAVFDGLGDAFAMLFGQFDGGRYVDYEIGHTRNGVFNFVATDVDTSAFRGELVLP